MKPDKFVLKKKKTICLRKSIPLHSKIDQQKEFGMFPLFNYFRTLLSENRVP